MKIERMSKRSRIMVHAPTNIMKAERMSICQVLLLFAHRALAVILALLFSARFGYLFESFFFIISSPVFCLIIVIVQTFSACDREK